MTLSGTKFYLSVCDSSHIAETALITGATGGLEREFSRIFAENGYDLILTGTNGDKLTSLKENMSFHEVRIETIACDLYEKDAATHISECVKELKMNVDVLVNNAGFGDFASFAECDWKKQDEMIQVNVVALVQLTKYFLGPMIERKHGRILNISSMCGFSPGPLMANYYATKAYVLSFSQAIAKELKDTGVTVTVLCPAQTRTGFENNANLGGSKLFRKKTADPADVARYGYEMMIKGKIIAVRGIHSKMLALGSRILPRRIVVNYIYNLQDKAEG